MAQTAVLFVHGAYHNPDYAELMAAPLRAAGYETSAPQLACTRWPEPAKSHQDDVAVVRAEVQRQIDAGRDVVLVMHSYGGIAGGGAVEGLEKKKSGDGNSQAPGVIAAVFLAAFLAPIGQSLGSMIGGEQPPYIHAHPDNPQYVMVGDVHEVFYNDMPPEKSAPWIAGLKPQSLATFLSEVTSVAWHHVPCTYILCEQDQSVPPELQQGMHDAAAKEAKYPFRIVRLPNGHSPWLNNPEAVAEIIKEAAETAKGPQ